MCACQSFWIVKICHIEDKTQVLPESTELRIANGVVSYEPVMSKLLNSKDLSLEKRFEDKTHFITRFHWIFTQVHLMFSFIGSKYSNKCYKLVQNEWKEFANLKQKIYYTSRMAKFPVKVSSAVGANLQGVSIICTGWLGKLLQESKHLALKSA